LSIINIFQTINQTNKMKKIITFLSVTLLLMFFLQSCQIEKRHYSSGYNIKWFSFNKKDVVNIKNKQQENKIIASNVKSDEPIIPNQHLSKPNESTELISHKNNIPSKSSENNDATLTASIDTKANSSVLINKNLIPNGTASLIKEQLSSYLIGQWIYKDFSKMNEFEKSNNNNQQTSSGWGKGWWCLLFFIIFLVGLLLLIGGDQSGVGLGICLVGALFLIIFLCIPAHFNTPANQQQEKNQTQQQQSQQFKDVIYLKDGGIIHGTIIEQVPNVSVKIKTKLGSVLDFKMDAIEKITKE
jgi:hypothetical protein